MATSNWSDSSLRAGARPDVKHGDSKRLRYIDHVIAWTFREARDLPQGTISWAWVASFLKRSETWVKKNWRINPYLIKEDEEQRALSQESKEVIRTILTRPKKRSVHQIIDELSRMRGKKRSYGTVYRFLKEEKARAFHIISKPKITEKSAINRLEF